MLFDFAIKNLFACYVSLLTTMDSFVEREVDDLLKRKRGETPQEPTKKRIIQHFDDDDMTEFVRIL